jgi:hypothetical protein
MIEHRGSAGVATSQPHPSRPPGGQTARETAARLSYAVPLIAFPAVCLLACGWALHVQAGGFAGRSGFMLAAALIITCAAIISRPLWGSCLVLFLIPFFGNHPGGRLMEAFNIPLAAATIGLAIDAARRRLPPPAGAIWLAAAAVLASAVLALIPIVPTIMLRAADLQGWPEVLFVTVTATETEPLYSVWSLAALTLSVFWAAALAWAAPGTAFAKSALRAVGISLLVVVGLGVADFHGLIDLSARYNALIDEPSYTPSRFQSVFWNSGWFSWYFAMAFGLSVGLLAVERGWPRRLLAGGLAIAYAYSLTNPQRGGFLALHASLAGLLAFTGRSLPRKVVLAAAGAAAVLALSGVLAVSGRMPGPWFDAVKRLNPRASPSIEGHPGSYLIRYNLYRVAYRMWRDAPVFGLGESSFAWRYGEYVPVGSAMDTGAAGDAHSTWFQLLATRGLAGVAAFVVLLAVVARMLAAALRGGGREARAIAIGLAVSLAAFFIYSFVQAMFYLQPIQVFFWALVALTAIVAPRETVAPRLSTNRRRILVAVLIGATAMQVWSSRPLIARWFAATPRPSQAAFVMMRALAVPMPERDFGFWEWQTGPDGVRYRLMDRRATIFVETGGAVAELPFHATELQGRPVRIEIMVDGVVTGRLQLEGGRWVSTRIVLPRVTPLPGRHRIDLTALDPWSPIRVGEIRTQ